MKKMSLMIVLGICAVLILLIVGAVIASAQFQPVASSQQPVQRFIIPKGQAVQVIAQRLQEEGIIRNAWALRYELQRSGTTDRLQAGSFELSPSMNLREVINQLTTGTEDIWITIPEGWRREEIADSLATQELASFDKAEFLELTEGKEGRLFPDTYLIPRQATAAQIVSLLSNTFKTKVETGLAAEIASSEYTLQEALVLASLVQREASSDDEMAEIAGVLWRRIEIGMPLQVDATLQYVKGYSRSEQTWWVPPLAADKQLSSPYNTYLNPGLPPAPIANPGVEAIRAALQPQDTTNLFYIHDRTGQIHFAETLDQHNANVNRYLR